MAAVIRMGDVLAVWEQGAVLAGPDSDDENTAIPRHSPARVRALRAAIGRAGRGSGAGAHPRRDRQRQGGVARELHRRSGRTGPLIRAHCAALQPSLVESELFGIAAARSTGAHEAQRGSSARRAGGSLFPRRIGELPPALQGQAPSRDPESARSSRWAPRPVAITSACSPPRTESRRGDRGRDPARGPLRPAVAVELHVPALRERRVDLHDWLVRITMRGAPAARCRRCLPTRWSPVLQPWRSTCAPSSGW